MKIKYSLPQIDFKSLRRVVKHFGGHLEPFKSKLALSVVTLLGVSAMTLLRPWPLKIVFDFMLTPQAKMAKKPFLAPLARWDSLNVVLLAAGMVLAVAIIGGLLSYAQEILTKTVGHGVTASIRLQLFSHVQRLPQSYHDFRETGELLTRLTGDINLLQDLLAETFVNFTGQMVLIIGMLVIAFTLDWQLALLILMIMPLFVFAALRFSRQLKSAAGSQREKYGRMVASMEETLSGISQVKVFAQEKERDKLVGKSVSRDFKAGLKATKIAAHYSRVVEIITAIGTALVLLVGARKAFAGEISPGDLIVFVTYLRGIYRPVQVIARLSAKTAKAVIRGEKIMEILELEPEISDRADAVSAKNIKGDIRFIKTVFSYINKEPILNELSCTIPQGKTSVLIGPTGAGKSTLAKLLLRLYEHQRGSIVIDGREISSYKVLSLRKRITSLTQDTFLFRTSIRDNIGFGRKKASPAEIEEAARLVGADEFIRKLPNGYDTLVGEGGLTLSGGQRQRISFARAALRNSPIMIFDEPATGLDIHSEREAKEALRGLKQDRTLLIITHRLNFLDLAEWAIFIRDGRLVEEGIPSELLENKKEFYKFVGEEAGDHGHYDGLDSRIIEGIDE